MTKYAFLQYEISHQSRVITGLVAWSPSRQWHDFYVLPEDVLSLADKNWHTYTTLAVQHIQAFEKHGLPGFNFGLGREICGKPHETQWWIYVQALLYNVVRLSDFYDHDGEPASAAELFPLVKPEEPPILDERKVLEALTKLKGEENVV